MRLQLVVSPAGARHGGASPGGAGSKAFCGSGDGRWPGGAIRGIQSNSRRAPSESKGLEHRRRPGSPTSLHAAQQASYPEPQRCTNPACLRCADLRITRTMASRPPRLPSRLPIPLLSLQSHPPERLTHPRSFPQNSALPTHSKRCSPDCTPAPPALSPLVSRQPSTRPIPVHAPLLPSPIFSDLPRHAIYTAYFFLLLCRSESWMQSAAAST